MRILCEMCGVDATCWHQCFDDECDAQESYWLCDQDHLLVTHCAGCGELFAVGQPGAEDYLDDSLDDDEMPEQDDGMPLEEDELLQSCSQPADALAVTLDVCMGAKAILGHSFADMRAAEKAVRKQCGVSVSHGSASGMNIALMEVRMLLVTPDCKIHQVVIRFTDPYDCNILLCSTAGFVLTDDTEIARITSLVQKTAATEEEQLVLAELKKRKEGKHKLVRCCASSTAYDGRKVFALAGAYSFFRPDGSTEKATRYELHHNGTYRSLVNGSTNDQLFNHSEQAGFKALYDQPTLLAAVITHARNQGAVPQGKLSLAAVAIDVFTTRSACTGCMKTAEIVLTRKDHFFGIALAKLVEQHPDISTETTTRIIRFDCAVAFKDGISIPKLPARHLILHGQPRDAQGTVSPPTGALHPYVVKVTCNADNNTLVTTGTTKTFIAASIHQAKEQLRIKDMKDPSDLKKIFTLVASNQPDLYSGMVLAAFLINRYAGGTNINAEMKELRRIAEAVEAPTTDEFLRLVTKMRLFRALIDEVLAGKGLTDQQKNGLIIATSYFLKAADLETTLVAAQFIFGTSGCQGSLTYARDFVVRTIRKLIETDLAPAENAARILAIFYDVVEDYKKLLGD